MALITPASAAQTSRYSTSPPIATAALLTNSCPTIAGVNAASPLPVASAKAARASSYAAKAAANAMTRPRAAQALPATAASSEPAPELGAYRNLSQASP
jgi:hypothetical protein